MADLGTLDTRLSRRYERALDVWAASNAAHGERLGVMLSGSVPQRWWAAPESHNAPCTYMLGGFVRRMGVPQAGYKVRLHLRKTGMPLAVATTDALGQYQFAGLPADAEAYFGIVLDPTDSENALILDRLTAG